jgi:hypothetical protein
MEEKSLVHVLQGLVPVIFNLMVRSISRQTKGVMIH